MEREILYIWLSKINGIGPVLARKLIEYFKRIDFVYEATYDDLIKVDGIGPKAAKSIAENRDLDKSKRILDKCERLGIEVVIKESKKYPKQLIIQNKAPIVLYIRGNLQVFENAVCIVGSRRCTEYGKNITIELAEALSKQNIPIISGMAKGIDGYAHTVALHNNNYTIAVLGTGADRCYPSEHITLMSKIIENGAVISQYEPGVNNIRSNFIKRNELMAMLSEKIVVVEASKDSGSLHTAHSGVKFGKQVYAVPGNINSKCSEGTNLLISEGVKPYLFTNDIMKYFKSVDKKENINSEFEQQILLIIKDKPMTIDTIKSLINLSNDKIEELLFEMESSGQLKQCGGTFAIAN